eukprot:2502875-Pyramimonas_sp.AAC.2
MLYLPAGIRNSGAPDRIEHRTTLSISRISVASTKYHLRKSVMNTLACGMDISFRSGVTAHQRRGNSAVVPHCTPLIKLAPRARVTQTSASLRPSSVQQRG